MATVSHWCAIGHTYCDAAPTTEPGGRTVAPRPTWDEYGLILAEAVSQRADCRRSLVGAVLLDNATHQIVGTGYNGVAPGQPGCLVGACPRGLLDPAIYPTGGVYVPVAGAECVATHAEINCLRRASELCPDLDYRATTIYVTRRPCSACRLACESVGIVRFIHP